MIKATKIITNINDKNWPDNNSTSTLKNCKAIIMCDRLDDETDRTTLNKMLQSCNLLSSEYIIEVITDREAPGWNTIKTNYSPRVIILLGITPGEIGISAMFHFLAPNRFDNSVLIPGPTPSELFNSKELKKQIWDIALKPTFIP